MFEFYRPVKRTFSVENPLKQGQALHLLPPLLETVRRLDAAETLDDFTVVACDMFSRNEENVTFTAAEIRSSVDYDQLKAFIRAYRRWLVDAAENDPN